MVFSKLPLAIRIKTKCADLMVRYEGKLLDRSTNLSSLDWKDGEAIVVTHWTFPLPDSEFNFGKRQELKNIDRTWKRKEPQRGFTLLHEFPLCAVFHCLRFWSKKIKNDNDEKSRRFFARFLC